jgi:hypothetical protein
MHSTEHIPVRKLVWVVLFGVAFGFVESSVVVYLRAIYYPEGFTWPLKVIRNEHLSVELLREIATIVMLAAVGVVAGRRGWQRFGYFLVVFGVWDIFYYLWLKLFLNWPSMLTEWDVLFLVPIPWIGPVIAAVLVALLMIVCGVGIVVRTTLERYFSPTWMTWMLSLVATAAILYSFMCDVNATLGGGIPKPYRYELLAAGLILYIVAYVRACTPAQKKLTK